MSSALTIQLEMHDFPDAPTLGVVAACDGRMELVALTRLHEPLSVAQIRKIIGSVVGIYLEPELSAKPMEHLSDYLSAVGERLV